MSDQIPEGLNEVLTDLGPCVRALGDYKKVAVLVGGVASLLYRHVYREIQPSQPPLTTFDMDWALPPSVPQMSDIGLHKQMQAGGFNFSMRGSGDKPMTKYWHTRHNEEAAIYAEFITERKGSLRDRHGKDQSIIEVEHDLHAQTDPYLGLLLFKPIDVDVSAVPGIMLPESTIIQLPHPMCFVIQKLLIQKRRPYHKQANDAAHIYDLALLTKPVWKDLATVLSELEDSKKYPAKWFAEAKRIAKDTFASETSLGPSGIANIFRALPNAGGAPTEQMILRAMTSFMREVGLAPKS